jgi:bifunctional oligoribonuclease and PAP phosphatase NrnA
VGNTSTIDEISVLLHRFRNVVITTHVNPDGDALGSELALSASLQQLGKNVTILNHNTTPDNYLWMDPGNKILLFNPDKHSKYFQEADGICIVDTNQPERLRSIESFVLKSKAVKIVIDHHLDPHPFGDHYLIDDDATSTGEIIYKLLRKSKDITLTKDIAYALYTAIMTDTGSFRYPRTDPETHTIASELIAAGANPTEIFSNVYEDWTGGRMRLLGEALDSIIISSNGKVAYMVCTQKMFRDTNTTEVETDNFTVYPMSIRGVTIGILFNELKNGIKISFRSKGSIPINQLAKEFGGNGHLNAAGARLFDQKLDEILSKVIDRAIQYSEGKIVPIIGQ